MVNNAHFEPKYQVHELIHTSPRKLALVLPNSEQNGKIMSLQKSDPTTFLSIMNSIFECDNSVLRLFIYFLLILSHRLTILFTAGEQNNPIAYTNNASSTDFTPLITLTKRLPPHIIANINGVILKEWCQNQRQYQKAQLMT